MLLSWTLVIHKTRARTGLSVAASLTAMKSSGCCRGRGFVFSRMTLFPGAPDAALANTSLAPHTKPASRLGLTSSELWPSLGNGDVKASHALRRGQRADLCACRRSWSSLCVFRQGPLFGVAPCLCRCQPLGVAKKACWFLQPLTLSVLVSRDAGLFQKPGGCKEAKYYLPGLVG